MNWVLVLGYRPQVVELYKSSSLTPESGSRRHGLGSMPVNTSDQLTVLAI